MYDIIKTGGKMNEYFNRLQQKYNYDQNIIFVLKRVVNVLIDYYGTENLEDILDKIFNVEIHVKKPGEDPNEYISNSIGIRDKYITSEEVDGYATTRPVIQKGEITSKSIIYLFKDIDLNNPLSWDVMVHELCHIIKMSEFYLNDNMICKHTGFQTEKYDFDGKLIDRTMTALEETTTSHDEVQIMNQLLQRDDYNLFQQGSGYAVAELYLQQLIKHMNNIDKNFEVNLRKDRADYANSIFTPFGVCFINNFFEECNKAMYVEDRSKIEEKQRELQMLFELIVKSMDDIVKNYTQMSKEEARKIGL